MIKHNLQEVCKVFYFDQTDPNKLIMVSQDKIMTFDYIKEQIKEKYDFANNVNE